MVRLNIFLLLSVIALTHYQTSAAAVDNAKSDVNSRVEIGGRVYFFGMDKTLTWYDAKDECASMGMQLATLDTQGKYEAVTNYIVENPGVDNWLWTSGHKASLGKWLWDTTGAEFTFTSWAPNVPDRGSGLESCLSFAQKWGGWDDDLCLTLPLNYLCENVL